MTLRLSPGKQNITNPEAAQEDNTDNRCMVDEENKPNHYKLDKKHTINGMKTERTNGYVLVLGLVSVTAAEKKQENEILM